MPTKIDLHLLMWLPQELMKNLLTYPTAHRKSASRRLTFCCLRIGAGVWVGCFVIIKM